MLELNQIKLSNNLPLFKIEFENELELTEIKFNQLPLRKLI